jgi:signal recognition particle receptor subunit alpha
MVFCGVNGVGKSTSLAKIACWLKSNGLRILIVACDTFRSAAIEQLEVHAQRLEIDLYQQGYGRDPASLAQSAIRSATGKYDVVLVDTAGRMQDNEPLMRSLCSLIHLNDPDLVLFVGEALVGNDGVDQLSKFDEALCRLSRASSSVERSIDGVILTKFDTIDDKVGAALSMVYTTGAPIVFLGTGQRYQDLKQMIPSVIVRSLIR